MAPDSPEPCRPAHGASSGDTSRDGFRPRSPAPPDEIAARWHLRRRLVYALIRAVALPVVQVGRSLRVPQRALEAFIAGGGWRPQPH